MGNFWFWKRLSKRFLKKELRQVDAIHSIGIDGFSSIGSFLAGATIKHIAQTIGSDLNFHWPKLKKYRQARGWERTVSIFVCNSRYLEDKIAELLD